MSSKSTRSLTILAIETSCDETSAAVLTGLKVRSNIVASQQIHTRFGGVVPELASRAHQATIAQTVDQALSEAGIQPHEVDAIAVTRGPGLMGALLVGVCFAKGLAIAWNRPLIGVNHVNAHVFAGFLTDPELTFPFLGLVVSGGHTLVLEVNGPDAIRVLGTTRDDAAGEAFDKVGKMLGLPYPAGPQIDARASQGFARFEFPRAMLGDSLDFSFSGLKTSVLYFLQKQSDEWKTNDPFKSDVCASVSEAITDVLIEKLKQAVGSTQLQTVVVAGGVTANSMLRAKLRALEASMNIRVIIPPVVYCTDNAAMIGAAAFHKFQTSGTTPQSPLDWSPFASY